MARYISNKEVHLMTEDLVFDNAICYLNDFEMPRVTNDGAVIFETYAAPEFEIETVESEIILRAVLSGFSKKEITVSIQDNILMIAGRKTCKTVSTGDDINVRGSFYREIYVPRSIDQDRIGVLFNSDELVVVLPKKRLESLRVLKIN